MNATKEPRIILERFIHIFIHNQTEVPGVFHLNAKHISQYLINLIRIQLIWLRKRKRKPVLANIPQTKSNWKTMAWPFNHEWDIALETLRDIYPLTITKVEMYISLITSVLELMKHPINYLKWSVTQFTAEFWDDYIIYPSPYQLTRIWLGFRE